MPLIVKSPKTVSDFADVIEYVEGILTFGSHQISICFPVGTTHDVMIDKTRIEEKRLCSWLMTKSQVSAMREAFDDIRNSVLRAGDISSNGAIVFSGLYRQNEDYTWGNPITIFLLPPVRVEKYRFDIGDHFKTVVIRDLARKVQ